MTARHLLARDDEPLCPSEISKQLTVRHSEEDKGRAVIAVFDTSPALDVVVLQIESECALEAPSGDPWDYQPAYDGDEVSVWGFATLEDEVDDERANDERPPPSAERVPHEGRIDTWQRGPERLKINMSSPPYNWTRISGAPVVRLGKICGVVLVYDAAYDRKVLRAAPTWHLLRDEKFCHAIGRAPISNENAKVEVRLELERILGESEALRESLASRMGSRESSIGQLAIDLMRLGAVPLLNVLLGASGLNAKDRRRTLSLLNVALPHAQDIASAIHGCDFRGRDADLRTSYRTIAECVLARYQARPATFGLGPRGQLAIRNEVPVPSRARVSVPTRTSVLRDIGDALLAKLSYGQLRESQKADVLIAALKRNKWYMPCNRVDDGDAIWNLLLTLIAAGAELDGLLAVRLQDESCGLHADIEVNLLEGLRARGK
ncbi:MAG: hypothetical protein KBG48_20830 [Kofleriaceae bacterium]|nr:hypothetical protein [Kofleriaceae bacterium]MBP9169861.1 hypothetical protein [Kofleriaceae bacterium]MBP9858048.1 hypothetical protein [Kofleriaceae bacterium]